MADLPERAGGVAPELEASVDLARRTVALGRAARAAPGSHAAAIARGSGQAPGGGAGACAGSAIAEALTAEVLDELNVRALTLTGDESEMVERRLYPLLRRRPGHGKAVGAIMAGARSGDWRLLDDGPVEVGGVTLQPTSSS